MGGAFKKAGTAIKKGFQKAGAAIKKGFQKFGAGVKKGACTKSLSIFSLILTLFFSLLIVAQKIGQGIKTG